MNLVKRENTTSISSFINALAKCPGRSIANEENGSLGTGTGVTTPSGSVVGCMFIWQR